MSRALHGTFVLHFNWNIPGTFGMHCNWNMQTDQEYILLSFWILCFHFVYWWHTVPTSIKKNQKKFFEETHLSSNPVTHIKMGWCYTQSWSLEHNLRSNCFKSTKIEQPEPDRETITKRPRARDWKEMKQQLETTTRKPLQQTAGICHKT